MKNELCEIDKEIEKMNLGHLDELTIIAIKIKLTELACAQKELSDERDWTEHIKVYKSLQRELLQSQIDYFKFLKDEKIPLNCENLR